MTPRSTRRRRRSPRPLALVASAAVATAAAATSLAPAAPAATPDPTRGPQSCVFRNEAPRRLPPQCNQAGDTVTVTDDGGGRVVGVTVPLDGEGVRADALADTGAEATLTVLNPIEGDTTAHGLTELVTTTTGGPNACEDTAYNFLHSADGSRVRWETQYKWHFKASTTPSNLTQAAALDGLKKATNTITGANGTCGFNDYVDATHAYMGTTTVSANIKTGTNECTTRDQVNVATFGDAAPGFLAVACTWYGALKVGPEAIVESDVRFDKADYRWYVPGYGTCSDQWSLTAVATHERGHTFGLDHVSESGHGYLTMSTKINGKCLNSEAGLGLGDVLGLEALY